MRTEDYERIAKALRGASGGETGDLLVQDIHKRYCVALADEFSRIDPQFDRRIFLFECAAT